MKRNDNYEIEKYFLLEIARMQRIIHFYFFIIISACLVSGCRVSKQLPYFTDVSDSKQVLTINTKPYEPLKLQVNDEIQVTISSSSPEAAQFFNIFSVTPGSGAVSSPSPGFINLYKVAPNGNITMPVLGEVPAARLTMEELKTGIKSKLKDYLKDAVVSVSITNFKVTVIGEVGRPVVIPVSGQSINVLEAVGAAGDMTVYGIRSNVKVVRKLPDGRTEIAILNFNKSSVLQSPYFQLQQNDIVYIQPNKNKGILGTKASIWVPIVTSLLYVGAIIVSREF